MIKCPLPWSALSVLPMGVSVCCAYTDDLRAHPSESAIEVFHGQRMRTIRRQLLNGQWPTECGGCQIREKNGLKSERQVMSEMPVYKNFFDRPLTENAEEIISFEYSSDNRCNLKCRMCSAEFSSRWSEDLPALKKIPDALSEHYYREFQLPKGSLPSVLPHLSKVRELVFKGGEPLMNSDLLPFLRSFVDNGRAGEIVVRIVSNGTLYNPELVKTLKNFKDVGISISVDGADPVYQYIRNGRYTAADIRHNIERYTTDSLPVRSILTAYQVYNMLHYRELVDFFEPAIRVFQLAPVFSYGLNVQHAPDELRDRAIRDVSQLLEREWPQTSLDTFNNIIRFLEASRFNPERWSEFKRLTHSLDLVRRESLAEICPELLPYLGSEFKTEPHLSSRHIPR